MSLDVEDWLIETEFSAAEVQDHGTHFERCVSVNSGEKKQKWRQLWREIAVVGISREFGSPPAYKVPFHFLLECTL